MNLDEFERGVRPELHEPGASWRGGDIKVGDDVRYYFIPGHQFEPAPDAGIVGPVPAFVAYQPTRDPTMPNAFYFALENGRLNRRPHGELEPRHTLEPRYEGQSPPPAVWASAETLNINVGADSYTDLPNFCFEPTHPVLIENGDSVPAYFRVVRGADDTATTHYYSYELGNMVWRYEAELRRRTRHRVEPNSNRHNRPNRPNRARGRGR